MLYRVWGLARAPLCLCVVAFVLLWAALLNRFPLVFPDSGTYLGIAFGLEYAIDRSSMYGWLLKPFVLALPGAWGLWLALWVQALAVAAALLLTLRAVVPQASLWIKAAVVAFAALLTSLPWHAGQFMPDAFTGPLVLVTWLAASREPGGRGAPSLWLAAVLLALTHYTHLALLPITALTAIAARGATGLPLTACARRAAAALIATSAAFAAIAGANQAVLARDAISPAGPLFLFARLHEDGLIRPWLDRHCGADAPEPLCSVAPNLPRDSQILLWGGEATPITGMIWHPPSPAHRWGWVEHMDRANKGAIAEQPHLFLGSALTGAARQLAAFQALDDECPAGCRDLRGGVAFALNRYRPETVPLLHASRQALGQTDKALVRAVTTPVALLAMLALPLLIWLAWRRRDGIGLSLIACVAVALLANAAMAGALSDVHDRYQSRIVWLAPLAVLLMLLRMKKGAAAGAAAP